MNRVIDANVSNLLFAKIIHVYFYSQFLYMTINDHNKSTLLDSPSNKKVLRVNKSLYFNKILFPLFILGRFSNDIIIVPVWFVSIQVCTRV